MGPWGANVPKHRALVSYISETHFPQGIPPKEPRFVGQDRPITPSPYLASFAGGNNQSSWRSSGKCLLGNEEARISKFLHYLQDAKGSLEARYVMYSQHVGCTLHPCLSMEQEEHKGEVAPTSWHIHSELRQLDRGGTDLGPQPLDRLSL